MSALAILIASLLDPFFIVPAGVVAWRVRDRARAFWLVTAVACVSTLLLALLGTPPALLVAAFVARFALGAVLVFGVAALRKSSTPTHT